MDEGSERFYEYIEENKLELVRDIWERGEPLIDQLIEDLLCGDDVAFTYIISSIERNKELNERLNKLLEVETRKHCNEGPEPEE